MLIGDFINAFFARFTQILNEHTIETMNHAIEVCIMCLLSFKIHFYRFSIQFLFRFILNMALNMCESRK